MKFIISGNLIEKSNLTQDLDDEFVSLHEAYFGQGSINWDRFESLAIEEFCKNEESPNTVTKPIMITFDDGNYSDFSLGFPVLTKYGFVATFFVTAQHIRHFWMRGTAE